MSASKSKSRLNVFVALLRGVNVGGNNMISMKALKESFETIGFSEVSTYINSGNVIFKSKETDARKLERKIEQMLVKDFELDSKLVVRSLSEMEKLVKSLPASWNDPDRWRYYVVFLRHTVDSEKILEDLPANTDVEEIIYRPGTLLWSALVSELTKSKIQKVSSQKLYKEMTIRNLNTTKKLHQLMTKAADTGA
ncbi:MAG TPA: DUF1697 domain-containing protein [Pyrinomonadaceae bacterium]|nr:DUF1697 domain-containing protein [Pyrinomonadaceae bacterium]